MTDNDIKKAFGSLYKKLLDVKYELKITAKEFKALNSVNALLNRQQAEIERLESEYPCKVKCGNNCEIWAKSLSDYDNLIGDISAEGIKEFAELVKMEFYKEFDELIPSIMADKIDNLVKERTESVNYGSSKTEE